MFRLWVLSASRTQRKQIETLFASVGVPFSWRPQPHSPGQSQTIVNLDTDAATAASELAKLACVFEIETETERFLFHPGLGLHRQELDEAGEPITRICQLKHLIAESQGSMSEFERRLRMLEGIPWLDILEPYRLGILRADSLPRAV